LTASDFDRSVFINCPFDADYEPILKALLFCVMRFGLKPRIATETSNAGETRIAKIERLILDSKFSIHDLSRCQALAAGEHYRMNMPFELGMDFASARFGPGALRTKQLLVLEEQPYRYQAAISDLAGMDIVHHEGKPDLAMKKVRNWLVGQTVLENVGFSRLLGEYEDFQDWYLKGQIAAGFQGEDFRDFSVPELMMGVEAWLRAERPRK
jgi:hypothetical protein